MVEPQANVSVRLTDHMGLEVGAGYRITGLGGALGDRLDGVTGALALQFGW